MNILVAEDDRDITDLIALYMQKSGWTPHVASVAERYASGDLSKPAYDYMSLPDRPT